MVTGGRSSSRNQPRRWKNTEKSGRRRNTRLFLSTSTEDLEELQMEEEVGPLHPSNPSIHYPSIIQPSIQSLTHPIHLPILPPTRPSIHPPPAGMTGPTGRSSSSSNLHLGWRDKHQRFQKDQQQIRDGGHVLTPDPLTCHSGVISVSWCTTTLVTDMSGCCSLASLMA